MTPELGFMVVIVLLAAAVTGLLIGFTRRAYHRLLAAQDEQEKSLRRRQIRGGMGFAGILLALYPVLFGKGIFEPRENLFGYADLLIGFTGIGFIVTGLLLFSDPEPPTPPPSEEGDSGDKAPDSDQPSGGA